MRVNIADIPNIHHVQIKLDANNEISASDHQIAGDLFKIY